MPRDTVLQGPALSKNPPEQSSDNAAIRIDHHGKQLALTWEQVSRGLLAVGAPGFGKTVSLLQIAEELRSKASDDDVFIFFDTKGDYLSRLHMPGDKILSYGNDATVYWNIFEDIAADGCDEDLLYDNAYEIATMLFSDKIANSQNPFFPKNGRDIVMGLLYSFVLHGQQDDTFKSRMVNNKALAGFFRQYFSSRNIIQELTRYPRTSGIVTSISTGDANVSLTPQTQGVLSEAAEVGREIFKGGFAREGYFSIRQFVRNKGAKALFIEYDMALGNTLLPIYRTLCDISLKEALSRNCNSNGGRVYVFMDEMRLLPQLAYLENAINFGRGMGLTVIAGIQNSSQIAQVYGDHAMRSILDSFGTMLIFNTANGETRRLLEDRIGKNTRYESTASMRGAIEEKKVVSNVVEDWDIATLGKGKCIVHTIGTNPYFYQFPNR